jgi:hypothetical protein
MAKKLRGDFFFLSANDLKDGDIVFYGDHGWTAQFDKAMKIPRNKIEFYESKCKIYEDKCVIVSPIFIEIDENGDILNLRDRIRIKGITIEI